MKTRLNNTKVYSSCHIEKRLDRFCRHKGNADGLNYWCKECAISYQNKNKERRAKYDDIRREAFKNRSSSEIKIVPRKKCSKCGKIKLSKYFVKNKSKESGLESKCKLCLRKYHEEHKLEEKQYRINHRADIALRARNRRKKDVKIRILESLRSRLCISLKRQFVRKSLATIELVGCDVNYLKMYLESKFTCGMSWNNYGKHGWWIDHIRPCASFDLSNIREQKECFNYRNLQPMWFEENIRKSSRYNGQLIRKGA